MHSLMGDDYTTFHFNGGFDGDIIIVKRGTNDDQRMTLPMSTLDTLFAERIRRKKISQIEEMSDADIIECLINSL